VTPFSLSRSQRRIEKKQAGLLLVLILAVSLVSFTLGVMVGKNVSGPAPAVSPASVERLPVARGPSPPPVSGTTADAREDLTFYDTLPKGEQTPLGSGINMPVAEQPKAAPAPKPAEKPAVTKSPAAAVSPVPETRPAAAAAEGAYVVQAASFRQSTDARALQERLAGKGYAAYVQSADLGEKGIWHRVYIGPINTPAEGERIAHRLLQEEKLTALIKRL
jgi:DedD protein